MINQRRTFLRNSLSAIVGLLLTNHLSGTNSNSDPDTSLEDNPSNKSLTICYLKIKDLTDIETVDKLLESKSSLQKIDVINWHNYSYKPGLKFRMAYCDEAIILKYYVSEQHILADITMVNGDVCKDSCVEFFISLERDDTYYNFEFNCIGVPHVEHGQKGKRVSIDPQVLQSIKVKSSLGDQPFKEKTGSFIWELMLIIPKSCFCYDKNLTLKGLKAKANFYKCGDKTTVPHYVSWNPVGTQNPDFHQPRYFGNIIFE